MGKNLKNSKLVPRTGKMAFYYVPGNTTYSRMEGFTDLSGSKSAIEHNRRYVDEDTERTDVTGYSTSTAYAFDRYAGNPVLDDIVHIHEDEVIGEDAVRSIIQVDMTTSECINGARWKATGRMRDYAVVPGSDGDTTDAMTYSGDFKARGEQELVEVYTNDNFQTIFVAGTETKPVLRSLSVMTGETSLIALSPEFSADITSYTVRGTGRMYINAAAESTSYAVTVVHNGRATKTNGASVSLSDVEIGDEILIIVDNGSQTSLATETYTITVEGE